MEPTDGHDLSGIYGPSLHDGWTILVLVGPSRSSVDMFLVTWSVLRTGGSRCSVLSSDHLYWVQATIAQPAQRDEAFLFRQVNSTYGGLYFPSAWISSPREYIDYTSQRELLG